MCKLSTCFLLLGGFLLLCSKVAGNTDTDFQYKYINFGVVMSVETIAVRNITSAERHLKELISTIINNNNTNLMLNTNSSTNGTRVSNVTVIPFDLSTDLTMYDDIGVLFSVLNCGDSHILNEKVTTAFSSVVHIAVTEPGCTRLDSATAITVPLTWYLPNADLLQLFIDIRKDKTLPKWNKVVAIYDVQAGQGILETFVQGFAPRGDFQDIALSLFSVDSMSIWRSYHSQVEEILAKYVGSAPANFVIITSVKNANAVLEVAKRMKLLAYNKQWLFVSGDSNPEDFEWNYVVKRVIDDGVNIAFISNSSSTPTEHKDQLGCHVEGLLTLFMETLEILAENEFNLYVQVSDEEWDIIKPSRVDRVASLIHNMTDRLEETVLNVCDKNSSTWLLEAGENGKFGKRVFQVGWWNPITGLRMKDDLFPHVTGAFRGRKINVASMHFPPWHMITRNSENETDVKYSGLMFEVLGHMAENLNFTFNVLEPRVGETWGVIQKEDGAWNGIMKMVIDKKVVIAAAAFPVTADRAQAVNYTEVMEREAYVFVVNRPNVLSRVLLFAEPFRIEVWGCIFIAVFIVSPSLYVVHRYSYYYKFYDKENNLGLYKMKNCFWYVYGALLQQGGTHLPEAISGRMLIGFWWLFVLVVVTTYSGSLVAFLTFPKVSNAVNSVDDLLHYRGVNSWGFLGDSIIFDLLKRSANPKFQELHSKATVHSAFNESVMELVRRRGHAYIDWKIVLLTAMADDFKKRGYCDFALGSEEMFEQKIALIVPRDSPYLPLFNKEITEMLQSGLMKKWKNQYWPQKDKCSSILAAGANRTVRIGDMQGSFYLLLMGMFIAVCVLLGEYCFYRRKKQKLIDTIKTIVTIKPTEIWQQKKLSFLQ